MVDSVSDCVVRTVPGANFTPGPWEAKGRSVVIPLDSHSHVSAEAYCGTVENARLIAAAPELLEALAGIVASWDRRTFERERHSTHPDLPEGYWTPAAAMVDAEFIANARSAIAKALGSQQ